MTRTHAERKFQYNWNFTCSRENLCLWHEMHVSRACLQVWALAISLCHSQVYQHPFFIFLRVLASENMRPLHSGHFWNTEETKCPISQAQRRPRALVQLAQPCLHCGRFQVWSAALDPVTALAEVDGEGEQQVVKSFKINGNFCFTLIKLQFVKSKSFFPNQHTL